jgi:hypothetical protein
MGRRKGELSSSQIDRQYPHQITIPADWCRGGEYHLVRYFCEGLSVASRTHHIVMEDQWHLIFCFAVKTDAEKFHMRFGGEWFDPARRGRGGRWHLLRDVKKRYNGR